MGICGSATINKTDKQPQKNDKNLIKISVVYNDEPQKECIINKNEKLIGIIKELGINEEIDYDFYDSNDVLINDKINEEISKIFNIKKEILISIKQASLKLSKDNRNFISNNTSLIATLTFNFSSSLGIFIYNTKTKQILSEEFSIENYPLLGDINNFTSFCNTKNSLYIILGEY